MATKIETLKKPNGDQVLPRTRAKAVSMESGGTVEAAIVDINTQISQLPTKDYVDSRIPGTANNGLSAEAKDLLINILRNCVYSADQSQNISALIQALNIAPSTFNGYDNLIHSWDFRKSLEDEVGQVIAETNVVKTSNGIIFTESIHSNDGTGGGQPYIRLLQGANIKNKAVEIDIASGALTQPSGQHARIFGVGTQQYNTNNDAAAFLWRYNNNIGWASYAGNRSEGGWDTTIDSSVYPINFFDRKTLRLEFDSIGKMTAYYSELGKNEFTKIATWNIAWTITEGNFIIGSYNDNTVYPATFQGVRIYEKEA